MDFFARQNRSLRQSWMLGCLFMLAVVLTVLTFDLIAGLFAKGYHSGWLGLLLHNATGWVVSSTLVFIGVGTLLERYRLSEGGRAIARRLGARRVNELSLIPEDQQVFAVLEEMSLASGVPRPALYILDEENSINGFVAGYQPYDMVMVLTWGAIQNLDRDELQGVIAHEYSHILHGDTRLNLRLLSMLGGLLLISQLGSGLFRLGKLRDPDRDIRNGFTVILGIVGGLIWLVGAVGVILGRLVKLAILRQREYLADAASIQFTRSYGVLKALLRIRSQVEGSRLHGAYAESISHFCFANALWHEGWLSTHPPLDRRIAQINPAALVRAQVLERYLSNPQQDKRVKAEDVLKTSESLNLSVIGEDSLPPEVLKSYEWTAPVIEPVQVQTAKDTAGDLRSGESLLPFQTVPKSASLAPLAEDARYAMARPNVVKRALLTSTGSRELLSAILAVRQRLDRVPEQASISVSLMEGLLGMDPRLHLAVFEEALQGVGALPSSAVNHLLTRLARVCLLDQHISLVEVVLLERVRAHLGILPPSIPVAFDHCAPAIAILVEALLDTQHLPAELREAARVRILRTLLSPVLFKALEPVPPQVNLGIILQQLAGMPRHCRRKLIEAAETCLWANGFMSQEEQDIHDLLAWRLGVKDLHVPVSLGVEQSG